MGSLGLALCLAGGLVFAQEPAERKVPVEGMSKVQAKGAQRKAPRKPKKILRKAAKKIPREKPAPKAEFSPLPLTPVQPYNP